MFILLLLLAQTTFNLSWTPGPVDVNHPAPVSWNVYRCPDTKIGSPPAATLTFSDVQTLPAGTKVCYAVSAVGPGGESSKTQGFGTVPQPVNTAPVVGAGPDQTVIFPQAVTLNGTVIDDGQPNGTLVVKWSKVLGPGDVVFASPTTPVTTATFSAPGSYVLSVQAYDGALYVADEVLILASLPSPAMPTNVMASSITSSSLVLNWQDNSISETRQEVRLQQVTPTRTYLIPIAADVTTLSVTGLRKGTVYGIQVRTINDLGASAWSPVLNVTTFKK